MSPDIEMERIRAIYPDAHGLTEGSLTFVHFPKILIATRTGDFEREVLLCPHGHSGYTTRLFLDAIVPSGLANWTQHTLFTRNWFTWSWNNIVANQPWTAILANHLAAFR